MDNRQIPYGGAFGCSIDGPRICGRCGTPQQNKQHAEAGDDQKGCGKQKSTSLLRMEKGFFRQEKNPATQSKYTDYMEYRMIPFCQYLLCDHILRIAGEKKACYEQKSRECNGKNRYKVIGKGKYARYLFFQPDYLTKK